MCGRFTVLTRDEVADVVAAVERKMGLASGPSAGGGVAGVSGTGGRLADGGVAGSGAAIENAPGSLRFAAIGGTECTGCGMCGTSVGGGKGTRYCWQAESHEGANAGEFQHSSQTGGEETRIDSRESNDGSALCMPNTTIERRQAFPGSIVDAFGLRESGLALGAFNWGFPVEWSKGPVFNTRIESALAGRGMWRDLVRDGRCIIPVASFFEPHATETVRSARTGRPVKRAYEFAAPDGSPLLIAGLSDGTHCSIVTTEPNMQVAPIHRRMPLALNWDEAALWLDDDPSTWALLADRSAFPLSVAPDPRQDQIASNENASGELGGAGTEDGQKLDEPIQLSLF